MQTVLPSAVLRTLRKMVSASGWAAVASSPQTFQSIQR